MNLKEKLKNQQRAQQRIQGTNAVVQTEKSANDKNLLPNDGDMTPQPVTSVPSSQGGLVLLTSEQQCFLDELLQKLNTVADKMVDFIPNDDNYIMDLSRGPVRKALVEALTPIMIDKLHELLKIRREEISEGYKQQRIEVEREGKTIILEDEALAYVTQKCYEVLDYHETLRKGVGAWYNQTKEYNQNRKKDRAHVLSEFRNAATYLKRLKGEMMDEMKGYLDTAIANKKAHLKPAPKKPQNNELLSLLRYTFISVPLYKVYCFLTDRYTLAFLHTAILSLFIILVFIICSMASNEAKLELEAEKYHLLRDWINIDSTRAVDKCFHLDGLFEDRDNNEEYIQRLYNGIRNEKMRRKAGNNL